jgi:hypothetical protein
MDHLYFFSRIRRFNTPLLIMKNYSVGSRPTKKLTTNKRVSLLKREEALI